MHMHMTYWLFNSAENNHVYTVMGDIKTHVVVFCSHTSGKWI